MTPGTQIATQLAKLMDDPEWIKISPKALADLLDMMLHLRRVAPLH